MTDEEQRERRMTIDRRSAILGAAFVTCAGLTAFRQPLEGVSSISTKAFAASIPAKVGGWTAEKSSEVVLAAPDETSDKLYQNLETRIYTGDALPAIMFLCAYSNVQKNDVQVHRPEVCYPASGYPITKNVAEKITVGKQDINARFLIADRGGPQEMILYWTRVGASFPIDWQSQRIEMAKANLSGTVPDGVLLRVSTIMNEERHAKKLLLQFIEQLRLSSNSALYPLIFG
jgi:EpsI family protein